MAAAGQTVGGRKDVLADVSMLTVFIGVNHPEIPARLLVEQLEEAEATDEVFYLFLL